MSLLSEYFSGITGFQWDEGNLDKNWQRHGVSDPETEQVFFNLPLIVSAARDSRDEKRFLVLGRTDAGRMLFVVFTIRGDLLRVISARAMNRRERDVYDKAIQD